MKGDYPRFEESLSHEELVQHFQLEETDLEFIAQFRGETNRHAVAVLLKSLHYLGYFPHPLQAVPASVRSFVAEQLKFDEAQSPEYRWDSGTRGAHFTQIRQYTGFRFPTAHDKEELGTWLRQSVAEQAVTFSSLFESAIKQLRSLLLELPSEAELIRLVNSARSRFFVETYRKVTKALGQTVQSNLERLLSVDEDASSTTFDSVKAPAGAASVKHFEKEIAKLETLRGVGVTDAHLASVPQEVQKLLFQRAKNETASKMREHRNEVRFGLMACFVSVRTMEVIDDIVQMFVKLIHRIDLRSQNQRDKQLLADFKRLSATEPTDSGEHFCRIPQTGND